MLIPSVVNSAWGLPSLPINKHIASREPEPLPYRNGMNLGRIDTVKVTMEFWGECKSMYRYSLFWLVFVNLIQMTVTWEEEMSFDEFLSPDWTMGMSVGHFLDG